MSELQRTLTQLQMCPLHDFKRLSFLELKRHQSALDDLLNSESHFNSDSIDKVSDMIGIFKGGVQHYLLQIANVLGIEETPTHPDLIDQYCEYELRSYPRTEEDSRRIVHWARHVGLMVQSETVETVTGLYWRVRALSPLMTSQTTTGSTVYLNYEVVDTGYRQIPNLAKALYRIQQHQGVYHECTR